jgi:antitoxin component YwqK of YwqJK toxin-antitoxin module
MEADFMAHQVQFLNKILTGSLLFLLGCNATVEEQKVKPEIVAGKEISLSSTDAGLYRVNGIVYRKNSPYTGSIITLFPGTSDTSLIERFLAGKEHGVWRKFYLSHRLKETRLFRDGKKVGDLIIYWENGNRQLHYVFDNDEYEGICREWNEAGMLTREMGYHLGHEAGAQKWWYDNGKIKSNYIISNGRRFGLLGTKNCVNVTDSIFKY